MHGNVLLTICTIWHLPTPALPLTWYLSVRACSPGGTFMLMCEEPWGTGFNSGLDCVGVWAGGRCPCGGNPSDLEAAIVPQSSSALTTRRLETAVSPATTCMLYLPAWLSDFVRRLVTHWVLAWALRGCILYLFACLLWCLCQSVVRHVEQPTGPG